jgi:hypothetical protein
VEFRFDRILELPKVLFPPGSRSKYLPHLMSSNMFAQRSRAPDNLFTQF